MIFYTLKIIKPGQPGVTLCTLTNIKATERPQIGETRLIHVDFENKKGFDGHLKIYVKFTGILTGIIDSQFSPDKISNEVFKECDWLEVTAEPLAKKYDRSMKRLAAFAKKQFVFARKQK